MNEALIIATAVLLLSLVAILIHKNRRQQIRQRQRDGVELLVQLRTLLQHTQKHRGASYGALNGDQQLQQSLAGVAAAVNQAIVQVDCLPQLACQDHWLAYRDHWQRLHSNNLKLEAENNLQQHNRLISVLLYLIEDVAEQANLDELASTENDIHNLTSIWRDLPRTAELVGQARVLGSGILAEGKAGTVDKIRMRFVRGKLQEYIDAEQNGEQALLHLVSVIDQQILADSPAQQNGASALNASDYFELSSRAMEPFFASMDAGIGRLKQMT